LPGQWHFWIDRGGTFTDVVARSPDGTLTTRKLLSECPERYRDPGLHAIRQILALPADAPVPAEQVASIRIGTTVATNALLERKGTRTLLVTTRGFGDALRIGYQNRPRLFDRQIVLPELLYERVIEVDERMSADGQIIRALDQAAAESSLRQAYATGIRSCAICLLHGYRYPDHERALAGLATRVGFEQVSVSHEVSPLMKLVGRGDTTVVDAYLSPILRRYVNGIDHELGEAGPPVRLMFMQSSGGLADARSFAGKDAILSGPAGGVVGMVETARRAGFDRLIGFDMGGTSTDVSHYAGSFERSFDTLVAGVRMRAPMMRIHTVAAGGGSILRHDGSRMQVGPESAGADPGPACYRRGGPLTVTDANVRVGKIRAEFFPALFGPSGDQPLDGERVAALFDELATRCQMDPVEMADGFLRIAVDNMARAIKKISVQRGHDVSRYALVCFGGAGGQHACRVADALDMRRVFIPPLASVLSAYGIGLADVRVTRQRAVEATLAAGTLDGLRRELDELAAAAESAVAAQGVPPCDIHSEHRLFIKYAGTDTPLELDFDGYQQLVAAFEQRHEREFGYLSPGTPLVVESLLAEAIGVSDAPAGSMPAAATRTNAPGNAVRGRFYTDGAWHDCAVVHWGDLVAGAGLDGPAIVIEPNSTVVIEPGWRGSLGAGRELVLERSVPLDRAHAIGTDADPVLLEIFNNLFMSIAEQMGAALEKTASTINIRERLDFSCALFDGDGSLVANAPHMPVHLGSMSTSVRTVIERNPGMSPGDVYVLNDPYHGGTHLPDITVVAPVHVGDGAAPLFYVAARGHHADVGGKSPGSMPADSRSVEDEGVLIDNFRLVRGGKFDETGLRALLARGPYPARNPDQNVADLKAQVAACRRGMHEIRRMTADFGLEVVQAYMRHVQDNAEESVRRLIDALHDSEFDCQTDAGCRIAVQIRVDHAARSATVDFSGTSGQQQSNFNAPAAVTRAAVLYVLRCMVDEDIPMNEGCLRPVTLVIPERSMLSPEPPAATVAGNVETSQVITDALFAALGAMAAAQGTMNNVTFGNDRFQYYETICGGAGAGPGFDGASAVHTHMTNSRMTDPEVLEWRFPVRLEEFSIRRGTGGGGRWRGGDGVLRRLRFLEQARATILSDRRRVPPHGLAGGQPGTCGRNSVERSDGSVEPLAGCDSREMQPGDLLVIETPGGGGWGKNGAS
jgi:5-oxoprolinase (ATP-hydrolysing)